MQEQYGLVGKNIDYSFSRGYFAEKFKKLGITKICDYCNFDLENIAAIKTLLDGSKNNLCGLNVTIPYKQAVLPFLDSLSTPAKKIGAVNTIALMPDGKTKGYNTDAYGFQKSLEPLLKSIHSKALILGTGGASKAIAYVFEQLEIDFYWVSRTPQNPQTIHYDDVEKHLKNHHIVVNSSPVGTFPNVEYKPEIPYELIGEDHLLYDLIYNPTETAFLKQGILQGATVKNGLQMLELQAEKSWQIWQENKT